jgi:hypothetical protein
MNWLIDKKNCLNKHMKCFCPIGDDGSIIIGMNYLSDEPPRGEKCIGEFWQNKKGKTVIKFYDEK